MLTRIIVGVTLSALMLIVWLLGPVWLTCFFYLALIIAAYEMVTSFAKADIRINIVTIAAFLIALPLMALWLGVHAIVASLFIAVAVEFLVRVLRADMDLRSITATVFTLIYPLGFMATLPVMLIAMGKYALVPVLLVVVVAAMTDTAAYFIGSFVGRTKLLPAISPKKTVEGSIGGVIGGVLSAIILYLILQATATPNMFGFGTFLLTGLLGGIVGQLGDLAASLLKRAVGIKDYGSIFPGHGGVLDRMDSIMFIAAMVYIFIALVW